MEHMQTNYTRNKLRPKSCEPLRWLEISFTQHGYDALAEYRRGLSLKTGRPVPLGVALDRLIKSHPACGGEQW